MCRSLRPSAAFAPLLTALGLLLPVSPLAAQLGGQGTQFWNQDSPGLGLTRTTDAEMGVALAAGDFDCDGFTDLAIGMPGDSVAGLAEAGDVVVLYSSDAGPGTANRDLLSQNTPGIQGAAESGDRFGAALAAGDFDNDDCDDLAIGAPGESIEDPALVVEAGAVHVLYGGGLGLGVDGDALFTQDSENMPGAAEDDDRFGSVLFATDIDLDDDDDLVIGVPAEDIEGGTPATDAGAVHLMLGTLGGLFPSVSFLFTPGGAVLNYVPDDFDRCGSAFAAPRVDIGSLPYLAIGVPGRNGDDPDEDGAGEVIFIIDSTTVDATSFGHSQAGDIPGAPEAFDHFGAALAAGDFDGDGHDEIAVGAPGEDLEAIPAEAAGAVIVIDLWNGVAHQLLTQDDFAPEPAEPFDAFGAALVVGDWNGDGVDDLAIGAPGETLGGLADTGMVHLVEGDGISGLDLSTRQLWLQTIDPSEGGDRFGATLVAGRFSGHDGVDLAIGVPGENLAGTSDTGGVNVLFSVVLFRDGFESANLCPWSTNFGGPLC